MSIEIELKFAIDKVPVALKKFPLIGKSRQVDMYYDTSDYAFLRRGGFWRLRDEVRLDFKGQLPGENTNQHDYCNEFSFNRKEIPIKSDQINKILHAFGMNIQNAYEGMTDFLLKNKMSAICIINKHRKEYQITKDMKVAIDNVKDIGLFLEAETEVPTGTPEIEIKYAIEKMRMTLVANGILPPDAKGVDVGYVELFLYKHNRAAHDVGLYKVK